MKKIKCFFDTPKKAVFSTICLVVILALIGAGTFLAASLFAKRSSIGTDRAREAAFAAAGIDSSAVRAVSTEFEFEDGHFVYKVDFTAGDAEYEYLVKASNGDILKWEIKPDPAGLLADGSSEGALFPKAYTTAPQPSAEAGEAAAPSATSPQLSNAPLNPTDVQPPTDIQNPSNPQPSTDIQNPASLQIPSGSHAGLNASDVTYITAKLDYDDQIPVYDIEFYTSSHEYEYEIHAQTGAVCHREQEAYRHHDPNSDHGTGNPSGETSDIGLETAKSIAVGHAGMIVPDVTFSKAEADYDDGYLVYEIEFFKDNVEYEYEIDAMTGEILKFDSDLYG